MAASDSRHRSASTFRIKGWSISVLPNALRCAAWWVACTTAARIPAAPPITQSRRVWPTISMIVGTPRPGSPTIWRQAPSSSISEEALERLPSLSLRRWMWNRVARRRRAGSREQEAGEALAEPSADSAWARTRKRSRHRRRAEPLVAGELVLGPAPPPFSGRGEGGVRAHVGAALLLGHRHARDRRGLLGGRDRAWVVGGGGHERLPLGRQLRLGAQRGHDREGHRDRAARTPPRPASRSCTGPRALYAPPAHRSPRQRVQLVLDAHPSSGRARRGGTRPRRSGCRSGRACGGSACSRSPAVPTAAQARSTSPTNRPSAEARSRTQPAPSRSVASTRGGC